jgi:thiol-disulfide isomerase/thioredoxin
MHTITGKNNLEEFIWDSQIEKKTTVIYFGATWCGPCQMLKDRLNLEETKEEMPNLDICYIDVDEEENEEICQQYKVKSLPLQIFIRLEGNKIIEIKKILGYDWINFLMTYNSINESSKEKKYLTSSEESIIQE